VSRLQKGISLLLSPSYTFYGQNSVVWVTSGNMGFRSYEGSFDKHLSFRRQKALSCFSLIVISGTYYHLCSTTQHK